MIKSDFPIFNKHSNLIYLDNGATTHKPKVLIEAISDYYSNKNSNVGRGVYELADISEQAMTEGRETIASFIGTKSKNIVFTSGCTDSINQVSFLAEQLLKPNQKIILSIFEHHANILPWQRLAKKLKLEIIFISDEFTLSNPESLPDNFWNNVGLISLTHVSNVTGQIHPIKKWCDIAKSHNIITSIDGAQGISSQLVNVVDLNCDFYSFSAHKVYGPMGLGILYLSDNILKNIFDPLKLGGGIVEEVSNIDYSLIEGNLKFEAGTPNVADIYAFSEVIKYLIDNNWELLLNKTKLLHEYLFLKLNTIIDIEIIKPTLLPFTHIVSFKIKGIHPHDIGTFLSENNIAIRVGKHCTHPLHKHLNLNSSARISLAIYNTKEDIDLLIISLLKCIKFFKG